MFGMVLTNAPSFDHVRSIVKKQRLDTIKVVTYWGLPWDEQSNNNRALICSLTPNTIVRTVSGDSSNPQGSLHPIPEKVIEEIKPWYECKRDIIIEIGNEPNMHANTEMYIYTYRWYLNECIKACRKHFPLAQIMSTALQPDRQVQHWYDIFSARDMNIYDSVDYVGVHAYEHMSFQTDAIIATNHMKYMLDIYKGYKARLFFSELGINGRNPNKLEEYRTISNEFPTTYYHYCFDRMVDSAYHVS